MGLFNKKPKERNAIRDNKLTEGLANAALQLLVEGEDYRELGGTQCEFGYLFKIENHGLEALFKIKTDLKTCYFAAQKDSLMRLEFNEELFQGTAEKFLSLHPTNP